MKRQKTLYQEIDEFMEDAIEGVETNAHYAASSKRDVYYALSNALGMIRQMKGSRTLKRKNK